MNPRWASGAIRTSSACSSSVRPDVVTSPVETRSSRRMLGEVGKLIGSTAERLGLPTMPGLDRLPRRRPVGALSASRSGFTHVPILIAGPDRESGGQRRGRSKSLRHGPMNATQEEPAGEGETDAFLPCSPSP